MFRIILNKFRQGRSGQIFFGLIAVYVGMRLLVLGKGGYRAGYSEGPHLKIVGAALLIVGIYTCIHWFRLLSKEAPPHKKRAKKK
jgi:hypothetical protein